VTEQKKVESKSLIAKADVINFTVILFVLLIAAMVGGQVWLAAISEKPLEILLDLRGWFIPLVSGIFLAYGLTKGQANQS
jgi:hypothetical protein